METTNMDSLKEQLMTTDREFPRQLGALEHGRYEARLSELTASSLSQ